MTHTCTHCGYEDHLSDLDYLRGAMNVVMRSRVLIDIEDSIEPPSPFRAVSSNGVGRLAVELEYLIYWRASRDSNDT